MLSFLENHREPIRQIPRENFRHVCENLIRGAATINPRDRTAFGVRRLPLGTGKQDEGLLHTGVKLLSRSLYPVVRASRGRAGKPRCRGKVHNEREIGGQPASSQRIRGADLVLGKTAAMYLICVGRKEKPVHQYNYTTGERGVNLPPHQLGSRGEKQQGLGFGGHVFGRIEQDGANRVAEGRAARLTQAQHFNSGVPEQLGQQTLLRRLASALGTLENDKMAGSHVSPLQERVMMELVAPFFMPSIIRLFT